MTFQRCHINTYKPDDSLSLVLDATSNDGYPLGNAFYDCSVSATKVVEEGGAKIGYNYFIGSGTYDLENTPDHAKLWGITDTGVPYNLIIE